MVKGTSGTSGARTLISGVLIPEMFNCLAIPDIAFAFGKSFLCPERGARIAGEINGMLQSSPQEARLFLFGHTDAIGREVFNKNLSDRRARSVYAVLTHKIEDLVELHFVEGWGQNEIAICIRHLDSRTSPSGPPLLPISYYLTRNSRARITELYNRYVRSLCPDSFNVEQFCNAVTIDPGGSCVPYVGCGSFCHLVPRSTDMDREVRNRENQPNRRTIIFALKAGSSLPCRLNDIGPCIRCRLPGMSVRAAQDSGESSCALYRGIVDIGYCPVESTPIEPPSSLPPPNPDRRMGIALRFTETEVGSSIAVGGENDDDRIEFARHAFRGMLELLEFRTNQSCVVAADEDELDNEVRDVMRGQRHLWPAVSDGQWAALVEARVAQRRELRIQPTVLVKTKVWRSGNYYYLGAKVVLKEDSSVLFEDFVYAPYLIGGEGTHFLSDTGAGVSIWRYMEPALQSRIDELRSQGRLVTNIGETLGLNNYIGDLFHWLLLKDSRNTFLSIARRVEDIMSARGYVIEDL